MMIDHHPIIFGEIYRRLEIDEIDTAVLAGTECGIITEEARIRYGLPGASRHSEQDACGNQSRDCFCWSQFLPPVEN